MQKQINPDFVKSFWEPRFPGQVPSQLAAPEFLEGDTLYLKGEKLKVVELGNTDTANSTAIYVPSVVAFALLSNRHFAEITARSWFS